MARPKSEDKKQALLEAATKAQPEGETADAPRLHWVRQFEKEVTDWNTVIDTCLRPAEILATPPSQVLSLNESAHEWRLEALAGNFLRRSKSAVRATFVAMVSS